MKTTPKSNFTQIPNELIRCPAISNLAVRVYLCIASFNPSYPSYAVIRKMTGIGSKTSVSTALDELARYNIISWVSGSNLTGKANTYRIVPVSEWSLPSPKNGLVGCPKNGLVLVQKMDSNNTKNNTNRQENMKSIYNEHQNLLNSVVAITNKTESQEIFLKDKQERLDKYGYFTAKQLEYLNNIIKSTNVPGKNINPTSPKNGHPTNVPENNINPTSTEIEEVADEDAAKRDMWATEGSFEGELRTADDKQDVVDKYKSLIPVERLIELIKKVCLARVASTLIESVKPKSKWRPYTITPVKQ